uniref:SFRICE_025129 n=1 Tax=Spodoptera frugiperda TaxID=7108 RepID=A0A2H1VYH4_SPOFR
MESVFVSVFGCLTVNHVETTERILMRFGIQTEYELTWSIFRERLYNTRPRSKEDEEQVKPVAVN